MIENIWNLMTTKVSKSMQWNWALYSPYRTCYSGRCKNRILKRTIGKSICIFPWQYKMNRDKLMIIIVHQKVLLFPFKLSLISSWHSRMNSLINTNEQKSLGKSFTSLWKEAKLTLRWVKVRPRIFKSDCLIEWI